MEKFTIKVEEGKDGSKKGELSVGPVYRNALAKDGFPPLDPHMITSWDVFKLSVLVEISCKMHLHCNVAAEKYQGNRMLGWREFTNGKAGPYKWKTCKEIYDEVVQVGSALLHLGAKPGSHIGIYGINCPQWIVAMEACNGFSFVCVPLYDTLGSGAVDYIVEHAEIDFVFLQDKKVEQILSSESSSTKRLK